MFIFVTLLLFGVALGDLNHIVDLTWDFDNDTIYWPGVTPFAYTKQIAGDDRGFWYSMNEFCMGEHGGTHFDAPYHFHKEGWTVEEIPVTRLVARGASIDLSQKNTQTENLLVKDLENWVRKNGAFHDNTVLLIKFGKSQYWTNKTAYLEIDANRNYNFPGLSVEASTWIANSGKIVGVGLDTPSVDPGTSSDMMAHRILAKHQIYNIENVKILVDLPDKGFTVVVSPTKLRGGTGAPVRVFAVPKGFL